MTPDSTETARSLRKRQTPAEAMLWRRLRDKQVNGRKWRRQQPIDQYVVDFFCPELRLVVEVDGDIHALQEEKDQAREAYLRSQGLTVLRVTNNDVMQNLEGVVTRIWEITG